MAARTVAAYYSAKGGVDPKLSRRDADRKLRPWPIGFWHGPLSKLEATAPHAPQTRAPASSFPQNADAHVHKKLPRLGFRRENWLRIAALHSTNPPSLSGSSQPRR